MITYKLLTPGPLTTSERVKQEMQVDHCTWDNDYKEITQHIRHRLLALGHVAEPDYTAVLMQGSGTFGVEAALISSVGKQEKLLVVANGAYGQRIREIAEHAGLNHCVYECHYNQRPDAGEIEKRLREDSAITHVAMVHCETTSGILNDLTSVARVVKDAGCTLLIDAMSSFGGIDIDLKALQIDFLISSANKCIQGVPGFSFVLCRKEALRKCKGKSPSLSLDLYDQWEEMDKDGKWRFTSPTHVVLAFARALEELELEGGIPARQKRYEENNSALIDGLKKLGISSYIDREHQSPIITTFFYPDNQSFSFDAMYAFIKARGYAIYPGKVTSQDTFRVGNIGEIYREDMETLCGIFKDYFTQASA